MRANQMRKETQFFQTTSNEGNKSFSFSSAAPFSIHTKISDGCKLSNLYASDLVAKRPAGNPHQNQEMLRKINKTTRTFNPRLQLLKEEIVDSKNSEINLNSFFEGSNACQLFIGKNAEIIAFNEVCATYIQKVYNLRLYTGAIVTDYSNEPYVAEFINNYYKALNGTPVQIKQQIKWDNEIIWCHFTYVPARNSGDEIIGVFFNLVNITKRIALKQKVFEQKQALTKIAFIQSHEVRRPVASILGLMNVFKASDYAVTKEELLMMEQAVNELDEKIREIVNHIY
ncbi:MAG TPA: PAS domain-containing protein [Mucilaginibacter sp.]|jgi:hypothetical protein|nr:PAS domain-containing protein [Mucilaginibacter sp.]